MVQVNVNEGVLEGEVVNNEYGGEYYSFKGIPYAEPPLGDLRFKAPQPKKPWDGVRSAKVHGSNAIQINPIISFKPTGSEDCLYLNVYTPNMTPSTPLPVMVWIHGGAFTHGCGDDSLYGPEFLIKHDIILVTINYRVEALGFLCLDTEDIPGNAGMKDQVQALRWVKNNIKSFGGDPENITIFGESAGGASTSFHLISPMSKGLFKRAIVQSGAVTCSWATCSEPRERALKLAKQLGFNSEDDKELSEFFKNVPAEKLVGLSLPVTLSSKLYELSFAIVDEKEFGDNERFFYGDVCDVLKNGVHEGVDVMTGITEDEGLIALYAGVSLEKMISTANLFKEFFVPKPIQINNPIKEQLEVGRKIKEFYFNKDIVSNDNKEQLFRFLSWDMFAHGVLLFAKLVSKRNNVYLYKMTCKSERNIMTHLFGLTEMLENKAVVCHADDLPYLFPFKIANLNLDQNSEAYSYVERMTKLWTNFAKFGNPTPNDSFGVKWSPFTLDTKSYLDLGNELVIRNSPDAEEEFWDGIFKEYLPNWTA